MQKLSKTLTVIGIVVVIIAVGILIGWLGGKGPAPKVQPPPERPAAVEPSPAHTAVPAVKPSAPQPGNAAKNPPGSATPGPAHAAANVMTNWEDHVDEILGSEGDETNKVAQLFAMFPRLPEDGQTEVAQHLSNLVEDQDYRPLGQLLENGNLPESVLDVLMGDVLNRPNSVKLPVLLDIAQNPKHPEAGEAKDILELFLDEDYGNDWNQWRQAMQQWLKENPD